MNLQERTHSVRVQQSQSRNNPPALTSPQRKSLFNPKCIHKLHNHHCRIPIRKRLLTRRSQLALSMSQWFHSDQVHGLSQFLVLELFKVEIGRGRKAVDQDESGLVLLVRASHTVAHFQATKMGNAHCARPGILGIFFGSRHGRWVYKIWRWKLRLRSSAIR